jgi:hypothetical protein
MIYVPDNLEYDACHTITDNYTMRIYEELPTINSSVSYIDVALDNHYIARQGIEFFGVDATLPTCIPSEEITHAWSYRTDFADILLCISILGGFIAFVIYKLLRVVFRGWF